MLAMIEEVRARAAGRSPALSDGRRHAGDLVEAVARGIDMFDCVLPTRNGRTAQRSRAAARSICATPTAAFEEEQGRGDIPPL
jgi:tRNA-guanine family transglycosylase